MKFYVKSYKEIKKTKQNLNAFADEMKAVLTQIGGSMKKKKDFFGI